jgi:hypothetical protein
MKKLLLWIWIVPVAYALANDRVERRRLARLTKAELYRRAQEADLPGRSTMSKDELADALRRV